jgi:hypothetical protein
MIMQHNLQDAKESVKGEQDKKDQLLQLGIWFGWDWG